MKNLIWHPVSREEASWDYTKHYVDEANEARCIGHLRGDFGRSGEEFWTTWWDHNAWLKTDDFREELNNVVNNERKRGHILHDFKTMLKLCSGQPKLVSDSWHFAASSKHYDYLLRCIPRRGDYNLYLYCYVKTNDERREAISEGGNVNE